MGIGERIKSWHIGAGTVVAAILAFGLVLATSPPNHSRHVIPCRNLVEASLKAPGTADFVSENVYPVEGGRAVIRGAVDAENSFGAKVRSDYECRYEGGRLTLTRLETR